LNWRLRSGFRNRERRRITDPSLNELTCTAGLFEIILLLAHATHLVGWVMLAATLIPIVDATTVLRSGGPKSIAYGVHGGTAAVMLIATALLLAP